MVKNTFIFSLIILIITSMAHAQPDTIRLDDCYLLAMDLSPLKKQELLNESIYELGLRNQQSNYLPSISLNGKATYQSEVISIPGTGMIQDYPQIPKEQFQMNLDINQNIYDGGLTKNAKKLEESSWILNQSELETELYSIRSTINDLFFSILTLQESRNILYTTLENLRNQQKIISARVSEGVILESNLYRIEKQILTIQQEIISVESDRNALMEVLSAWIGEPVGRNTVLKIPVFNPQEAIPEIDRPENEMFQAQRLFLETQRSMVQVERSPKFSAFVQGGIGQPNPVNFFEIDPSTYYILGIRLNWPVINWGNVSRKKQALNLQQDIVDTRESNFSRNIQMILTRLYTDIEKLEEVLKKDHEIIVLQEKIVNTAFSEFQHGVINSTDYLTELSALTESEIKRSVHKIQLAEAYIKIYTSSGQEF
ncbi:MAG: TolC family protein [Cyclobacteriaceae bacterium]|nr:TolC family protein [Cyclobacteriaceae bacterium]